MRVCAGADVPETRNVSTTMAIRQYRIRLVYAEATRLPIARISVALLLPNRFVANSVLSGLDRNDEKRDRLRVRSLRAEIAGRTTNRDTSGYGAARPNAYWGCVDDGERVLQMRARLSARPSREEDVGCSLLGRVLRPFLNTRLSRPPTPLPRRRECAS